MPKREVWFNPAMRLTSLSRRNIAVIALLIPGLLNATDTEYYRRPATILAVESERDCIRVRLAPERRVRNAQASDIPLYLLHSAKIFHVTPGGQKRPATERDLKAGMSILVTGDLGTVTEIRIPQTNP